MCVCDAGVSVVLSAGSRPGGSVRAVHTGNRWSMAV